MATKACRCAAITLLLTEDNICVKHRNVSAQSSALPAPYLQRLFSPQAAVVAEAYEFVPDWAEVLYQQVIAKGDFSYLEEFKQQRLLKPAMFEEIAKK